jgi:hypothetical protein
MFRHQPNSHFNIQHIHILHDFSMLLFYLYNLNS